MLGDSVADDLQAGDRRALARAITLLESSRPDDRDLADKLVGAVLPRTGGAVRVGVTGPPGVGKSTLIEALGEHILAAGARLAVLAVDPSSSRFGGSILGDKTRMTELSRHDRAYVRPSPSRGDLGGLARRTRDSVLLCEAAGFDTVIVETVGVGQSEVAVAGVVDTFVLLVAAGGGDELQGIKRGVMELADVLVVTKADGDLRPAAGRAVADHRAALHLLRRKHPAWEVPVIASSAPAGVGIAELWEAIGAHRAVLESDGTLRDLRADQARRSLHQALEQRLVAELRSLPGIAEELDAAEAAVADGTLTPGAAVERLIQRFRGA